MSVLRSFTKFQKSATSGFPLGNGGSKGISAWNFDIHKMFTHIHPPSIKSQFALFIFSVKNVIFLVWSFQIVNLFMKGIPFPYKRQIVTGYLRRANEMRAVEVEVNYWPWGLWLPHCSTATHCGRTGNFPGGFWSAAACSIPQICQQKICEKKTFMCRNFIYLYMSCITWHMWRNLTFFSHLAYTCLLS